MCGMMHGGNVLSWDWLMQGSPITWLFVFLGLTAVVALIMASAALARALVGFLGRLWRSRRAPA